MTARLTSPRCTLAIGITSSTVAVINLYNRTPYQVAMPSAAKITTVFKILRRIFLRRVSAGLLLCAAGCGGKGAGDGATGTAGELIVSLMARSHAFVSCLRLMVSLQAAPPALPQRPR